MTNNPKRALIVIHAANVADFRAQLAAAIAEATRVGDVPVLDGAGQASEAALVSALADVIERECVGPAVIQSQRAKAA